jgi:hypothetical protein
MCTIWKESLEDYAEERAECIRAPTTRNTELGNIGPYDQAERQDSSVKPYEWTHVHSFFAGMGGFAVDSSIFPPLRKCPSKEADQLALHPATLTFIAEHEPQLIPNVSVAFIEDKSKASALAKTLVCIQAVWFCIQCIFRLVKGLSISLLELNTLGHALCALVVYTFWWQKPLDIDEPLLVKGRRLPIIGSVLKLSKDTPLFEDWLLSKDHRESSWEDICKACRLGISTNSSKDFRLVLQEALQLEDDGDIEAVANAVRHGRIPATLVVPIKSYTPTSKDIIHWKAASQWIVSKTYRHPPKLPLNLTVRPRLRNTPVEVNWNDVLDMLYGLRISGDAVACLLAFTLAGGLYGGFHLLAWQAPFTSFIQQLLWRVCASAIAASGPFLLALALIAQIAEQIYSPIVTASDLWWRPVTSLVQVCEILLRVCIWVLVVACLLSYLFARTYLVVECFISLPYLPESVLEEPRWTGYFPHIQ